MSNIRDDFIKQLKRALKSADNYATLRYVTNVELSNIKKQVAALEQELEKQQEAIHDLEISKRDRPLKKEFVDKILQEDRYRYPHSTNRTSFPRGYEPLFEEDMCDGGYVVTTINGRVSSQGETIEEAYENIKEAVELYLEQVNR